MRLAKNHETSTDTPKERQYFARKSKRKDKKGRALPDHLQFESGDVPTISQIFLGIETRPNARL